ncbi:hypothetical protein THICB2_30004 [Thiomonas sp. CB2]|nr:hypothetical protein THICB2_30004 [Thiomonas sp. CB2]VDY06514.1 protein of unknown function [Thiomonas sp. Bio17B3]VDY10190.1 protein of unknown function [Thiomonas sp. Sup16B3]VDY14787.1 conserved protein of unknown function [Thiomonas sp. OC7]VDY16035.1 protein of unknown function [Thiomonas sp. CB2]
MDQGQQTGGQIEELIFRPLDFHNTRPMPGVVLHAGPYGD